MSISTYILNLLGNNYTIYPPNKYSCNYKIATHAQWGKIWSKVLSNYRSYDRYAYDAGFVIVVDNIIEIKIVMGNYQPLDCPSEQTVYMVVAFFNNDDPDLIKLKLSQ
jgi:hypothetical protein